MKNLALNKRTRGPNLHLMFKLHEIRSIGSYSAPPDPIAGFKGPTSKGREGKGRKWEGEGRRGKEGKGGGRGPISSGGGRAPKHVKTALVLHSPSSSTAGSFWLHFE